MVSSTGLPGNKTAVAGGFDYSMYDSTADPSDVFPAVNQTDEFFVRRLPIYYPDGTRLNITERTVARDASWGTVISFLRDDSTEHEPYDALNNVCTHSAVKVHDRAEWCGIKAHIVLIRFSDGGNPHVIVGFNTTDRGMVYVDDTGLKAEQKASGLLDTDRLVDLVPGQPYKARFLPPFDTETDTASLGVVESVEFIT